MSCAFEIPPTIIPHVTKGGMDLSQACNPNPNPNPILPHVTNGGMDPSQACNASGITSDPRLGEHGGLIGLLSSNRLTREEDTVQALSTALFFAAEAARPWYAPSSVEAE